MFRTTVLFCCLLFQMDFSISLRDLRLPSVPSASALCYSVSILIVAYSLWTCIYNLFFHPLAKFPGPWPCAMSEWCLIFFIRAVPTYGFNLHKKYGEVGLNLVIPDA